MFLTITILSYTLESTAVLAREVKTARMSIRNINKPTSLKCSPIIIWNHIPCPQVLH